MVEVRSGSRCGEISLGIVASSAICEGEAASGTASDTISLSASSFDASPSAKSTISCSSGSSGALCTATVTNVGEGAESLFISGGAISWGRTSSTSEKSTRRSGALLGNEDSGAGEWGAGMTGVGIRGVGSKGGGREEVGEGGIGEEEGGGTEGGEGGGRGEGGGIEGVGGGRRRVEAGMSSISDASVESSVCNRGVCSSELQPAPLPPAAKTDGDGGEGGGGAEGASDDDGLSLEGTFSDLPSTSDTADCLPPRKTDRREVFDPSDLPRKLSLPGAAIGVIRVIPPPPDLFHHFGNQRTKSALISTQFRSPLLNLVLRGRA
ncbi:hypothetical protein J437_LFUL017366 [Ladona fulva]|uniref:Uncharacterized protein n=1 Tax=Ladona fulva TaxID=123851 RepID=A0A8K0KRR3_LADFU|nr:hypothetical protein J437_LFUL017366 [Ladona fulva]